MPRPNRVGGTTVGVDQVYGPVNDLAKRVAQIEDQFASTQGILVSLPEVDSGFTPIYERQKNGVFVTLAYFIPGFTESLKVVIVERALIVDADAYNRLRVNDKIEDIEDADRAAGRIERRFDRRLKYNTQYDVIRLIAIDENGGRHKNPEEDPAWGDYPGNVLFTFTTPEPFDAPSAPDASLIIVNVLDPDTERFDARLVLRIFAPLNLETGAAQSWQTAQVDQVAAVVNRITPAGEKTQFLRVLDDDELTQIADGLSGRPLSSPANRGWVDIQGHVDAAAEYNWVKNIAFTNGERKVSTPLSTVQFFGANLRPGTSGLPELTSFSFTASVKDDASGVLQAHLELDFQQANPAIGLRGVRLAWKFATEPDTAYRKIENSGISLRDDRFHQAGLLISDPAANNGPITWPGIPVKPKKKTQKDVVFRFNLVSRTGIQRNGTVTLDVTAINEPSDPNASLILSNELDPTTKRYDARVVFRVHSPLTDGGAAQTFRQAGVESVFAQVTRVGKKTRKYGGDLTSAELDQTDAGSTPANRGFVDIEAVMKAGAQYSWDQNIIKSETEVEQSEGSPVVFNAGGLATAASGIPELTSLSITRDETAPYDGKNSRLTLNFTQPATPVALRDVLIEIDDGGGYRAKREHISLKKDTLHTAGAKSVVLGAFRTKKLLSHTWRATITAEGDATRQVTLTQTTADALDPAATPGDLAFPVTVTSVLDTDPEKNRARTAITVATSSGTFAANNIQAIELVYTQRNAANSANVGNPLSEVKVLSAANLSATSIIHEFHQFLGDRYRLTEVIARNGDKRSNATGTLDWLAGGVRKLDSGDATTVPAPSFASQPAADGNKLASFTLRVAQDGSNIIWLKSVRIEVSYGGGTFRHIEGSPLSLKQNDALFTSAFAFEDFIFTIKRKPGVTLSVRATNKAVGGKLSATTTSTLLAASAEDRVQVTSAPATQVSGITLGWNLAGPRINAHWTAPAGNKDALRGYFAVFTDNAGTAFMHPNTGASVSEASAERFKTSEEFVAKLRKGAISATFSGGVKLKVTPVWIVAGVDTKGTALSSSLLTLGNEYLAGTRDVVAAVDVGVTMQTSMQILQNGDMLFGGTNINRWNKSGLPFSGGSSITQTTTDDIFWVPADHLLKWRSNASGLYGPLKKRIIPLEILALTFMAKTDGSHTPTVVVRIRDLSNNDRTVAAASIVLTGLTSSYQMYGCVIQRVSTVNSGVNEFLELTTASVLSVTNNIIMDKFMLVRGKQPAAFSPRVENFEFNNGGASEDPDNTPNSSPTPDLGNPSGGTQGGWVDSGSGAKLDFETF